MNDILIALAKAAILVSLNQTEDFDLEGTLKTYPTLTKNGASFITLHTKHNNELRGCIGSLQAYQPLYKDIISNAQSAALKDPRFKHLTLEELHNISIEVSILSKPKRVTYTNTEDLKSKIKPFYDGVILKVDKKRATFLPQVWKQLPNFNIFFSALCRKAGLKTNCISENPEIYLYRVKKYKEK